MPDDTETDCALCRDLDPAQRVSMRADLLVIPLHDPVCDGCVEVHGEPIRGLPQDRRGEDAEAGGDGTAAGIGRRQSRE
jgi:hypothetical protein